MYFLIAVAVEQRIDPIPYTRAYIRISNLIKLFIVSKRFPLNLRPGTLEIP